MFDKELVLGILVCANHIGKLDEAIHKMIMGLRASSPLSWPP